MRSELLFLLALSSLAAPASAEDAERVLRRSLERPRSSYEGEIKVVTRGEARTVLVRHAPPGRWRREVVDASGKTLLVVVSDGKVEWVYDVRRASARKGEPMDADYKLMDPDEEYALLTRNYELRLAGKESVAGRSAVVLEALSRRSGKLARRLWVGRDGLVLRRGAYAEDGSETSSMEFLRIEPLPKGQADFSFTPPPGVKTAESRWQPDFMDVDEAAAASGLKPRLPAWLPQGFVFESVNVMPYKGGSLLHIRFSDGVDALSLFQCPPGARLRLGWGSMGAPQAMRVAGEKGRLAVSAEGKVLEWHKGTERFVLIGPLSTESMKRVAESVPEK
jgi:outer membrane lipoprotein-sorting protein